MRCIDDLHLSYSILSLPDDPAILKQIIATRTRERDEANRRRDEVHRKAQQLEIEKLRLEMELLRLKKMYYGPRADRLQTPGDVAQMLLEFAGQLESRPVNPDDLPPDEPLPETGTVRRIRRGRRNLASFENLPVVRREHDLPEAEKPCPCCGTMRETIGSESSWQVEYIPGHFERIEHVRIKYACKKCEQNADPPPDRPGGHSNSTNPPADVCRSRMTPSITEFGMTNPYASWTTTLSMRFRRS